MPVCKNCGQTFAHKSSLSRHQKYRCSDRADPVDSTEALNVQKIYDELIHLRNAFAASIQTSRLDKQNGGNILITNNNSNNNNINITINQFGKEDLSHLTNLDLDKIVYRTKLGLIQLMEYIHFRQKIKSNKNVRVTDVHREMFEYYNGKRWMYAWKQDILERMVEKGIDIMSDHFDSEQDKLQKQWSPTMYEHVEKWIDLMQEKSPCVHDEAINDMCLMLYNYSNIHHNKNGGTNMRPRRKSI